MNVKKIGWKGVCEGLRTILKKNVKNREQKILAEIKEIRDKKKREEEEKLTNTFSELGA